MAAPTEAQLAHQALLDEIDIHSIHKSFRSPNWRPNHRRNKNIKTIMTDASRKEASSSAVATPAQDVSGAATPMAVDPKEDANDGLSTSGTSTPAGNITESTSTPNLAQASRSLSKLVLEKTLRQGTNGAPAGIPASLGGANAPGATYTNIESAPSLAHTKHYCDVTGLVAPYLDPKTRMRYHNKEVFGLIRTLPQGVPDQYLEARGAHVVLK